MSFELLYSSSQSGLRPGSRGFCTVLCTRGMPAKLVTRLETLSGYRHIYPPQDPHAGHNPICWSHVRVRVSGSDVSVLSRIAAFDVDYSGRSNKLAHHLVVEPHEWPPAGPAWLLRQRGLMRGDWDGRTATPESGPAIPRGDQPPSVCHRWQAIGGDAGWGGVVAESFLAPAARPQWIIYAIEQRGELLGLIDEAIALLPEPLRWKATFSTYCTNLPPEVDCRVRCVPAGSEEARAAAAHRAIDLTQPGPVPAETSLVEAARSGASAVRVDVAADFVLNATALKDRSRELAAADDADAEFLPPRFPMQQRPRRWTRTPPSLGSATPPRLPRTAAGRTALRCFVVGAMLALLLAGGVVGAWRLKWVHDERIAKAESQAKIEATAKKKALAERDDAAERKENLLELERRESELRSALDDLEKITQRTLPTLIAPDGWSLGPSPALDKAMAEIRRLQNLKLDESDTLTALQEGLATLEAASLPALQQDVIDEQRKLLGEEVKKKTIAVTKVEQYMPRVEKTIATYEQFRKANAADMQAVQRWQARLDQLMMDAATKTLPAGKYPLDVNALHERATRLLSKLIAVQNALVSQQKISEWKSQQQSLAMESQAVLFGYQADLASVWEGIAELKASQDRAAKFLNARTIQLLITVSQDAEIAVSGGCELPVRDLAKATAYQWGDDPAGKRPLAFTNVRNEVSIDVPKLQAVHFTVRASSNDESVKFQYAATELADDSTDKLLRQCHGIQTLIQQAESMFLPIQAWSVAFTSEGERKQFKKAEQHRNAIIVAAQKIRVSGLGNVELSTLQNRLKATKQEVVNLRKDYVQQKDNYEGSAFEPALGTRVQQLQEMEQLLGSVENALSELGTVSVDLGTITFHSRAGPSGELSETTPIGVLECKFLLRVAAVTGGSN